MATRDDLIKELNRRKLQEELTKRSTQQPEVQNVSSGMRSNIPTNKPSSNPYENLARNKFGIGEDLPPPMSGRIAEPLVTAVSGMVAEPVAGLAGLAAAANPFAEEGAGARTVKNVRDALTIQPSSPEGKQGLKDLGETIAPVADAVRGAEVFMGDTTFELTGSPTLSAAAETLPALFFELIGAGTGKLFSRAKSQVKQSRFNKSIKSAVVESAPQIEKLKEVSRGVYTELEQAGVTLKTGAYSYLVQNVEKAAKERGFNTRSSATLLPKSDRVIKSFNESLGDNLTLIDIDNLRKEANVAARSADAPDAAVGASIVNAVDDFLGTLPENALSSGTANAAEIAPKFRVARDLWGRAKKSEMLNEAMAKADLGASGLENGLVIQFRQILNNKKKAKFFKKNELKAMKDVVQGDFKRNMAKLIGKFGFTEGHVTGLIGGSLGVAAGATVGGTAGAIAVPVIGQVSKQLAQRLTKNTAVFADQVVRAGSDADKIAAAYIKHTPKSMRSADELSELLSRPDISLETFSPNDLIIDAVDISKGNKVLTAVTAAQAARESTREEVKQ